MQPAERDAEALKKAEQWFHAALSEPVENRANFCGVLCRMTQPSSLRSSLLLEAHDSANSPLRRLGALSRRQLYALLPSPKVGNFEMVALLGLGGMG